MRIIAILTAICVLAACAQRFQNLAMKDIECGPRQETPFDVFAECVDKKMASTRIQKKRDTKKSLSSAVATQDHALDSFLSDLDSIKIRYQNGHLDDKAAYYEYSNLQASFADRERLENQQAQAVGVAILVGGAVAAAAYNSGGGGGGSSFAPQSCSLQGCCSYHGGLAGYCIGNRPMCNDGQLSPTCTACYEYCG